MIPGSFPLRIYHGDTYHWNILIWSDSGKTQPADLTGVTPKAEIRDKTRATILATFLCSIIEPNTIDMELTASASDGLTQSGFWDLQLTYSNGDVSTILSGQVTVIWDVTK